MYLILEYLNISKNSDVRDGNLNLFSNICSMMKIYFFQT